jgi:hypothetical protein
VFFLALSRCSAPQPEHLNTASTRTSNTVSSSASSSVSLAAMSACPQFLHFRASQRFSLGPPRSGFC